MTSPLKADLVVVGAGIAALWTFSYLRRLGYKAMLVVDGPIGGAQSLASQGMIHGGQKYTLSGFQSAHALDISAMPQIWEDCLNGKGDLDLRAVEKLSDQQVMWSPGSLTSQLAAFFASKVMTSKVVPMEASDWPEVFKIFPGKFPGRIYRLGESVLDSLTLMQALVRGHEDFILEGQITNFVRDGENLKSMSLVSNGQTVSVEAAGFVFGAGAGNEKLIELLDLKSSSPLTQRRPLRQVMFGPLPYSLYGHCIGMDPKPRVTISAHPVGDGQYVWYLGGLVAENGASSDEETTINAAKELMLELFPWLPWASTSVSTLWVDRAEPYDPKGSLKSGHHVRFEKNYCFAWPSKLTFAPALARELTGWVKEKLELAPSGAGWQINGGRSDLRFAVYPWQNCKWTKF